MTATTEAEQAKLNNAILAKEKALSEKKDRYEDQAKALDHMGEALREAGVNTDNLTEESKRLEQEMARLRNEQEQAADSAESFGEQAGAAFEAISSAILAAGISDKLREIGSAYMETVKTADDFEASMSQVAATMGVGSGDVGKLSEYAMQMGASTSFTARQAAEG